MSFKSVFDRSDKFTLSVRLSLSIEENRSFLYNFPLNGFSCVMFVIHEEYGIGLNVDFSSKSTS